jgi:hypothetical protein
MPDIQTMCECLGNMFGQLDEKFDYSNPSSGDPETENSENSGTGYPLICHFTAVL